MRASQRALYTAMKSSNISSYPPFAGPSQTPRSVVPLLPLQPNLFPPGGRADSLHPALPSRPKDRRFKPPSGFTASRHVIPAAWPRSFRETTGTLVRESKPFLSELPSNTQHTSSEERKARAANQAKEIIRARLDATPWTEEEIARGDPGRLWIAGESWRRENPPDDEGLTVVVTHANGFTKETWFPTFHRLLTSEPTTKALFGNPPLKPPHTLPSQRIDQVWFLDDIHHGESIDLNAGLIGPVHSWADGGRDVLNLIQHILPDASSRTVPENLEWKKESAMVSRHRKVIGVGHSVGGNALVRAAYERPDLFHALFLIEPMLPPTTWSHAELARDDWAKSFFRVAVTTRRRDTWPSLDTALQVRQTPFFSTWHEDVFKSWATHHLVSIPVPVGGRSASGTDGGAGPVQLATPSWAEAAVFTESTGLAEGWDRLPQLKVPVGFLMAGDASATTGEKVTGEMVWRPPIASNERFMDATHLLLHEKPYEVADALLRFLAGFEVETSPAVGASTRHGSKAKL